MDSIVCRCMKLYREGEFKADKKYAAATSRRRATTSATPRTIKASSRRVDRAPYTVCRRRRLRASRPFSTLCRALADDFGARVTPASALLSSEYELAASARRPTATSTRASGSRRREGASAAHTRLPTAKDRHVSSVCAAAAAAASAAATAAAAAAAAAAAVAALTPPRSSPSRWRKPARIAAAARPRRRCIAGIGGGGDDGYGSGGHVRGLWRVNRRLRTRPSRIKGAMMPPPPPARSGAGQRRGRGTYTLVARFAPLLRRVQQPRRCEQRRQLGRLWIGRMFASAVARLRGGRKTPGATRGGDYSATSQSSPPM